MDATAKKLISDIKKKKFEPVYVLQGDEAYFIDMIADTLEENVVAEHERGFNQMILYGKDVSASAVVNNARRFPMMAERQLVMVKEAQDIQDINKEQGGKVLLDYFTRPVPSTVLVLCMKNKPLDKRKVLGNKADKLGLIYAFKKLSSNQLPDFINEYFSSKGFKVDYQGVQVLCEYVGNDLGRLTNEIDKALIGLAAGEQVTANHIMSRVGISREYNIFELQKAVLTKNIAKAYQIVQYYKANTKRNPVIVVIAFFYSLFSKLLVASTASDGSESGLTSLMKISPYQAREYAAALRIFNSWQIMQAVSLISKADLKLKGVNSGSGEDDGQILQELIFGIISGY